MPPRRGRSPPGPVRRRARSEARMTARSLRLTTVLGTNHIHRKPTCGWSSFSSISRTHTTSDSQLRARGGGAKARGREQVRKEAGCCKARGRKLRGRLRSSGVMTHKRKTRMKAAERPSRFRPFPRVATKLRYFSSRFRSLKPSAKYCAGPLTFITDDAKESACSLRWRRGGREVQVSSLRNGSRVRATVGALPFSSSPFFFSGRAWTHSKLYSSLCRSLRQHTFTMTSRNTMAGAPRFAP